MSNGGGEAMSKLRWTKGVPTKPGWYWWRCEGFTAHPIVVYVYHGRDELYVELPYAELKATLSVGGEWAGPIEKPKE